MIVIGTMVVIATMIEIATGTGIAIPPGIVNIGETGTTPVIGPGIVSTSGTGLMLSPDTATVVALGADGFRLRIRAVSTATTTDGCSIELPTMWAR
jgi:hypothetical protein